MPVPPYRLQWEVLTPYSVYGVRVSKSGVVSIRNTKLPLLLITKIHFSPNFLAVIRSFYLLRVLFIAWCPKRIIIGYFFLFRMQIFWIIFRTIRKEFTLQVWALKHVDLKRKKMNKSVSLTFEKYRFSSEKNYTTRHHYCTHFWLFLTSFLFLGVLW